MHYQLLPVDPNEVGSGRQPPGSLLAAFSSTSEDNRVWIEFRFLLPFLSPFTSEPHLCSGVNDNFKFGEDGGWKAPIHDAVRIGHISSGNSVDG